MALALALFLSGLEAKMFGYPALYGPFLPGKAPKSFRLNTCASVGEDLSQLGDINGTVQQYRIRADGQRQGQITLTLHGTTNGWIFVISDSQGKSLMPAPFTNSMTSSLMEVFSGDLNQDGTPDFIVNVWSGGTGLAMDGSEVTFLLSSKDGYRASSFYQYAFGKEDVVRFNAHGPVYFIHNQLIGNDGEKTRDGHDHKFWVYNLNRIDGSRFIPDDADQPGFPKWVWFTNQANHDETIQLSKAQKDRLLIKRNSAK